jgi:hypothetical protein
MSTQTEVRYSKERRQWIVQNGRIVTFPPGPQGRRNAYLLALWSDAPRLHRIVSDVIEAHANDSRINLDGLTDRLLRAARLVLDGHVHRCPDATTVTSQSNTEVSYTVTWRGLPLQPHCTCPDHEKGGVFSYYGPVCKHTLADLLVYFTNLNPTAIVPRSSQELLAASRNVPVSTPDPNPQPEPTPPEKSIWDLFVDLIDRQKIAIGPDKEHQLWHSGKAEVVIWRHPQQEKLTLIARNGHVVFSKPLAFWGKDFSYGNGSRGIWKLSDKAKDHYDEFVTQSRR